MILLRLLNYIFQLVIFVLLIYVAYYFYLDYHTKKEQQKNPEFVQVMSYVKNSPTALHILGDPIEADFLFDRQDIEHPLIQGSVEIQFIIPIYGPIGTANLYATLIPNQNQTWEISQILLKPDKYDESIDLLLVDQPEPDYAY